MKATLYGMDGKKKGEIELPEMFNQRVREDIVVKYLEAEKEGQPYSAAPEAGRRHSAAGTISHKRHDWKGHYGQGRSRAPRKTMWRRGTQFYWIGAEVSGARGGRKAHAPELGKRMKKINKKEAIIALHSGFAATGNQDMINKRYESINKVDIKAPFVIESKLDNVKTKNLLKTLQEVLGKTFDLALKKKETRPGKGKLRGRKYKSNAGLLLVKAEKEKIKVSGMDVRNVREVSIADLYPLGRLTVYTEKALEEMSKPKAMESKK